MLFKSPIPLDELKFNVPVAYQIHVDRELLKLTTQKVALARYPEEQSDFNANNWSQGAKVARVRQLAEYWEHEFDWEKQEVCAISELSRLHSNGSNDSTRKSSTKPSTTS